MTETPIPIKWHTIFAAVLRELLTPLQIRVLDEFTLTGEVDVILIQLLVGQLWTAEQRQYLPDGLRDSVATHLLIEFKYTQSLEESRDRACPVSTYLYRQQQAHQKLPAEAIQTFIVSAITPQAETLTQFGYAATDQAGVYRSQETFLRNIPLILLNELSLEQHNAFFKLFASRRKVKLAALETLKGWGLRRLQGKLFWLIKGLLNVWFKQGADLMEAITVETLIEDGKHIMEWLEPLLTEEDILQLPIVQKIYRQGQQQAREQGLEKGREEGLEKGLEQGREEGLEEGLEKGLEKGREEGARQEALALLLRTLPRLFGEIPPDVAARLQGLTLAQLRQTLDLAFEVQNWPDFEQRLREQIDKSDKHL